MSIFDNSTESGKLLQDGYNRLCDVDYDPNCEMVDVINEYDDLPNLENALDSLTYAMNKIIDEHSKLNQEVTTRLSELKNKIETAEIVELKKEV